MAKTSQGSGNTATSTTKPSTSGQVVKLGPGNELDYLCAHICFTKKNPVKGKVGQILNQRACTAAIWKQEEANDLIWRYKAEVGYRMKDVPPSPIMSKSQAQRASRFPLGVAMREGMFTLSELETSAKGRLRIPDVIILKVTDNELINMRLQGKADWTKLIPAQRNISKVVEIKFGDDRLSEAQKNAYIKIAGDKNNFKLLEDTDCNCNLRNSDPNRESVGAKYTYIQNTLVEIKIKHLDHLSNTSLSNSPTPIGDFLDRAPLYEIVAGIGIVIVVVGVIAIAPPAGGVAAGALGSFVLVAS